MAIIEPLVEVLGRCSRLTLLVEVFVAYILSLVIYRLYLSPIAKFPGPTLTAITSWYQFYHDVIRGGQFTFVIQEWHKKYGPIIRINPTEIHISNPDFYDIIYSNTRVNKEESFKYRLGNPGSMHSTMDKDLHHRRRAVLASYFSRREVLKFTPYIQRCADKLCHRLNDEYKGTLKVVTLKDAFAAFAADNIIYYAFAKSYDFLDYPNFEAPFTTAIDTLLDAVPLTTHFPWIMPIMESLPMFVSTAIKPSSLPYFKFREEIKTQTRETITNKNEAYKTVKYEADKDVKHKTVFQEILHSKQPLEELSLSRLHDEAMTLVTAGIVTTHPTLSIACFHVLSNPSIHQRLCQELTKAFPDPTMQSDLPGLEKLPYLTAVIQESLRLSYGTSQRLPRIFDSAIEYGSYTIPPGVPVSLTTYIQHHDERVFPSSHTFNPDRWLDNPQAPNTEKSLSNYLVSFSKGTRNCIGMNLAYAEIYIGLATLFRRVNMELFETQRDAVDMAVDHFAPFPKAGTKGVRVLIK